VEEEQMKEESRRAEAEGAPRREDCGGGRAGERGEEGGRVTGGAGAVCATAFDRPASSTAFLNRSVASQPERIASSIRRVLTNASIS